MFELNRDGCCFDHRPAFVSRFFWVRQSLGVALRAPSMQRVHWLCVHDSAISFRGLPSCFEQEKGLEKEMRHDNVRKAAPSIVCTTCSITVKENSVARYLQGKHGYSLRKGTEEMMLLGKELQHARKPQLTERYFSDPYAGPGKLLLLRVPELPVEDGCKCSACTSYYSNIKCLRSHLNAARGKQDYASLIEKLGVLISVPVETLYSVGQRNLFSVISEKQLGDTVWRPPLTQLS